MSAPQYLGRFSPSPDLNQAFVDALSRAIPWPVRVYAFLRSRPLVTSASAEEGINIGLRGAFAAMVSKRFAPNTEVGSKMMLPSQGEHELEACLALRLGLSEADEQAGRIAARCLSELKTQMGTEVVLATNGADVTVQNGRFQLEMTRSPSLEEILAQPDVWEVDIEPLFGSQRHKKSWTMTP